MQKRKLKLQLDMKVCDPLQRVLFGQTDKDFKLYQHLLGICTKRPDFLRLNLQLMPF